MLKFQIYLFLVKLKNETFRWNRATAQFFRTIFSDFYTYAPPDNLLGSPSHEFDIPSGCEKFVIVSNVRNPYTLSVSSFKDILEQCVNEGKDLPNFED